MSSFRLVWPFLRGSRRRLIASVAAALLQSALLVGLGLLVRRAFDDAIPDDDVSALVAIGGAILVLALLSAATAVWTRYLVLGAVKDAIARLRVALLERLNTLPAAWFDRQDAGTLHATVVQDTERLDIVGNAIAAQLVPAVVIGFGLSVALIVIDPVLFAILAVALPVLAILTRRFDGVVRRRTRAWQLAFDRFATRVHVAVRARRLITTSATEDTELDAARTEVVELSDAGREVAWVHGAFAQLQGVVGTTAGIVVLVVGGAAVARGSMSLGSLVAFYTLVAVLRAQGNAVLTTLPQAISGRESLARLAAILEAPDREPYSGTRAPSVQRSLALREVEFGYRDGAPLLRGFDLELEHGERVTLVGPNGAGKTTVAALLLGLYRPWRGRLEADGVAYDELDIRALRRLIGYVPQQPILLPGTVAENIAYGSTRDDARTREAAELALADHLGYGKQVGDEGELLSGGERQRIAIARALATRPPVLILDEPTSNLDRETVARVLANLRALASDPAVLLISHDPAVLEDADRVVQLVDGVAVEAQRVG